MNNYQSQQEIIRLIRSQLLAVQVKSISCLVVGITSLIATPLIAKDIKLEKDNLINISGFITGVGAFGYALILCPKLKQLSGKNRMINELEKDLFIQEQMTNYERLAQSNLQQTIEVQPTRTNSNQLTEPIELKPLEIPNNNNHRSSTDIEPIELTNGLGLPDSTIIEVVEALETGVSDSNIIKEILGYKSERYQQGKQLLESIKADIIK